MQMDEKIVSLRMERQFLHRKANEEEYVALYRDISPGQNEYWHGFGEPPVISFRAGFDDIEFNRQRQNDHRLLKGRFQGGNLGWVQREDLSLFAGLALKPLQRPSEVQQQLLELIDREGPMNIQTMKEITGLLVKQITPALHRLQEAFLVYEDQYDGEWDRAWYRFGEMFPGVDVREYTRVQALQVLLPRFAYRHVWFDEAMAKSFYKLPLKDVKAAVQALLQSGRLAAHADGYMLPEDALLLQGGYQPTAYPGVYVLHRNDCLVKANEHCLKERYKRAGSDVLQYILLDGVFCGAVLGQFKYGPYIMEDVVLDLPAKQLAARKAEILAAIHAINGQDNPVLRFMGEEAPSSALA